MKKDIITKSIIKDLAKDISKYILKLDIGDDIKLIEKEFDRVEKREVDILYKNANRIIHIEIQNNNDHTMPLRMLRYYSDIKFEYNSFEIEQFVIYIGKEKCYIKDHIKDKNLIFSYKLIDMKDIDCEKFLYSKDVAAVALSILCDFKDKDRQLVVNTILKRLKLLSKGDNYIFRKYMKAIEVLSENRDLTNEIKKGAKMLVVDIEKMPSYEIGFERGVEKGIEKGIEKGLSKAILILSEFGMKEEEIAQKFEIPLQKVQEIKKEKLDFDEK